jgi:hypothetical protein
MVEVCCFGKKYKIRGHGIEVGYDGLVLKIDQIDLLGLKYLETGLCVEVVEEQYDTTHQNGKRQHNDSG